MASTAVLDARTDVWSLGCTVFTVRYGKMPFDGSATSAASGNVPFPLQGVHYADTGDTALRTLIRSMLAVDMRARPTVHQVLADAEGIAAAGSSRPGVESK